MTAFELLECLRRFGVVVELDGDKLKYRAPKTAAHLKELLREHELELINIVRAHGGRVANFPRCPQCASYALYRKDNLGKYECLTCGMLGIAENLARASNE